MRVRFIFRKYHYDAPMTDEEASAFKRLLADPTPRKWYIHKAAPDREKWLNLSEVLSVEFIPD